MRIKLLLLIVLFTRTGIAENTGSTAIFAGGCFWCIEEPFDALNGVTDTILGYTGGHKINPTYEEVATGDTGHTEAILITFDPSIISYSELISIYWKNIDPLAVDEQFCDYGSQYRSGIYYLGIEQETIAKNSLQHLNKTKFPNESMATEILPASNFYPAESYHQNYYLNNPVFYKILRFTCGRDRRLEKIWSKQETN